MISFYYSKYWRRANESHVIICILFEVRFQFQSIENISEYHILQILHNK